MLLVATVSLLFLLPANVVVATKPGLPNFVFILADDLGNYEIGYKNPQVLTPHINDLAATGLRLEQHYTYQFCSPTR